MRVSVVMATYNGTRFLAEQLDSIANQTRVPEEMVVSDDNSADDSVAILEDFARRAPFSVTVLTNAETLGYGQNFNRALKHSSGDLVFLSDQDDVWYSRKIETIVTMAESNKRLLYVHDLLYTDRALQPLGLTSLSDRARQGRPAMTLHNGCATVVRKELLRVALPVPRFVAHDNWLHAVAEAARSKAIIGDPLAYYRMHGENATPRERDQPDKTGRRMWPRVVRRLQASASKRSLEVVRHRRVMAEAVLQRFASADAAAVLDSYVDIDEFVASIGALERDVERYRTRESAMDHGSALSRLAAVLGAWRGGAYSKTPGGLLRALVDDVARP